jgi:cell division protein FtsQ
MWDKPDVLRRAANILFTIAGVLAAYGTLWWTVRLPVFAVREIYVTGDAAHVTRDQIDAIVSRELGGTFFTLDLPRARRAFEKLPWVREVNLRRRWPARLEVNVTEHVPIARWGSSALVNAQGEVFQAAYDGTLPTFVGPEGTSKEIAIQYEYFRRNLAPLGTPVFVQMTARRAWQVRLDGGPTLELRIWSQVQDKVLRYP